MVNIIPTSFPYGPQSASGNTAQDALKALIQSLQQPPQPGSTAQDLFSQIDTNNDGSITKTDVETAVAKAGGSKQAADALYAKLDPNNTGSVSAQQFAQNLPKVRGHHHHHGGQKNTASAASTASDGTTQQQDAAPPTGGVLDTLA